MEKKSFIITLLLVLSLFVVGCSGDGIDGTSGELALSLADAPVNNIAEVNVTITEVQINSEETGWEVLNDFSDNGDEFRVNLLDLRFDEALLGQKRLETGKYTQIRLILADGSDLDEDEEMKSNVVYKEELNKAPEGLFVPSGEQTGLKIDYDFVIEEGVITRILLDADVREMLNETGESGIGFILRSTAISVINQVISGDIEGRVIPAEGLEETIIIENDVIVEALDDDGEVVTSTVAITEEQDGREAGTFRLRGLEEGTYSLRAYVEDNEEKIYVGSSYGVEVTADNLKELEEDIVLEAITTE